MLKIYQVLRSAFCKLILGSISSGTGTENITKSFYLKRENSFFELRKLNPRHDFLNKQNFAKKCLPNVKKDEIIRKKNLLFIQDR